MQFLAQLSIAFREHINRFQRGMIFDARILEINQHFCRIALGSGQCNEMLRRDEERFTSEKIPNSTSPRCLPVTFLITNRQSGFCLRVASKLNIMLVPSTAMITPRDTATGILNQSTISILVPTNINTTDKPYLSK